MNSKKLVIHTQYRENYGAHDWDGEGECPQYWKSKGGDIYVYENVTPKQEAKIAENGIPTLANLINHSNDYSTNHIIDFFVTDAAVVADSWEYDTIHWLEFDHTKKDWFYRIRSEKRIPTNGGVSRRFPLKTEPMKYN